MVQVHEVIRNPDLFDENYLPSDITGRETQLKEISFCLKPARRKMKPINMLLFGDSGTGKTLAARHLLKKHSQKGFLEGIYINCWENNSFYSILDKMVRDLRILGAEKLNIGFKLERFGQFIGNKPFIIILDEFDRLRKPETDSIIYNFSTHANIGLICICQSRHSLYALEKRTFFRLNARQIFFPPYTEGEICVILEKRALFCLASGSFGENILKDIAGLAGGNARHAVQTLRNAACIAQEENNHRIGPHHIRDADYASKDLEKSYLLSRLNSHHRLLYGLVKERKEIRSGELWKAYLDRCRELGKQPMANRTFSEYMNKLVRAGLICWDRAMTKGKVRVFSVGE